MTLGYFSLFLLSFGAATVIPIGSEPLFTYMLASGGDSSSLVATATLGNWLGGLTTFGLGYLGRWERASKLFRIDSEKAEKWREKVAGKGSWFAVWCWTPIVGDIIAFALGLARANPLRVALFMLSGKFLRYVFLAIGIEGIRTFFS